MLKKYLKAVAYGLLGLAVLAIFFILYLLNNLGRSPSAEEEAAFAKLPYYKDGIFQSPQKLSYDTQKIKKRRRNLIRLFARSKNGPKHPLAALPLDRSSFASSPKDYAIYWLGHASVIMELHKKRLIFDPVLGNAAPVPFMVRRYGKAPIRRKDLPPMDYIVITHNHYDHLEKKTVQSFKTGKFIVPLGVGAALRGWGIDKSRITELGWGDHFEENGLRIIAVEGVHFSMRTPFNRNKTLWNSYVLHTPKKNIFWSGDTGYSPHFKRILKRYGPFDLAVLEIDAWNAAWPQTHLFPFQVVQAARDLGAKTILPIHWAIFDLGGHPWHESIDKVLEEARRHDLQVLTPIMGQKLIDGTPTTLWWRALE